MSFFFDLVTSYAVHDRDLRNELNEYGKRLHFLVDHLHSELAGGDRSNRRFAFLSMEKMIFR